MRTRFAPQAPGIAARPLSPAEIAGIMDEAQKVDRLVRRIGRNVRQGIRLMLASVAADHRPATAACSPDLGGYGRPWIVARIPTKLNLLLALIPVSELAPGDYDEGFFGKLVLRAQQQVPCRSAVAELRRLDHRRDRRRHPAH